MLPDGQFWLPPIVAPAVFLAWNAGDFKSKNVAKKMNQGFIMCHCQFHVGISLRSPNWLGDPDVGMLE